jgi:hypothetical protein
LTGKLFPIKNVEEYLHIEVYRLYRSQREEQKYTVDKKSIAIFIVPDTRDKVDSRIGFS